MAAPPGFHSPAKARPGQEATSKRVVKANHRRDPASKSGIVDWKEEMGGDQEALSRVHLDTGGAEDRVERT